LLEPPGRALDDLEQHLFGEMVRVVHGRNAVVLDPTRRPSSISHNRKLRRSFLSDDPCCEATSKSHSGPRH
jgi:hypothetical protein